MARSLHMQSLKSPKFKIKKQQLYLGIYHQIMPTVTWWKSKSINNCLPSKNVRTLFLQLYLLSKALMKVEDITFHSIP